VAWVSSGDNVYMYSMFGLVAGREQTVKENTKAIIKLIDLMQKDD
jgi:hypothetical protein